MNLATFLSSYLTLNLFVLFAYGATLAMMKATRFHTYAFLLRCQYLLLTMTFLLSLAQPFFPRENIFQPVAKVWSAGSLKSFAKEYENPSGYIRIPNAEIKVRVDHASTVGVALIAFLLLVGGVKIGIDLYSLARVKRSAFLIKNIKNTKIYSHLNITVPFSYWTPWQANIVMPTRILSSSEDYQIALSHELQHHRQQDTKWVYALWLLRMICILNPFIHLWNKKISEIQEFACDEALLGQRRIDAQAYARCLFEVAKSALNQKYIPGCATGLVFLTERNLLERRIRTMLYSEKKKTGRIIPFVTGAALAVLMISTAFAGRELVQDRRISTAQAQQMAENARQGSDLPVVVNELVVEELNRYLGTPEGREFIHSSLARMNNYREMVVEKIHDYRLPQELLAIPIIESGYQNLSEKNKQGWGAGLWMFIKSTARHYGLRVDEKIDERLNERLLTDAAMRYLQSNYLRFQDWHLAILAYNIGEQNVQNAIEKTGSRDAWVLIRGGYENDRNYLPKLMAAILIMKNPQVLE